MCSTRCCARSTPTTGSRSDIGHLTVFGTCQDCLDEQGAHDQPAARACPARWPATASTPRWRRTTARSTVEQRALENGDGFVDLSHRDVVRIEGPDRLTWLHSLTTQHLESLAPGVTTAGAGPRPAGPRRARVRRHRRRHRVHAAHRARPGRGARGVPRADEVHDARRAHRRDLDELAVTWRPARGEGYERYELVPRDQLAAYAEAAGPAAGAVGVRGAADRPRRAAVRRRHRRAHHPQRGRLDRLAPCTWTRAATAARRPSPGCTPSAGRRAG